MKFSQLSVANRLEASRYASAYLVGQDAPAEWWQYFAKLNAQLMREVERHIKIEYVEGQPYAYASQMFRDIESGIMRQSVDFNTHPVFTEAQNLEFRVVHDWHHFQSQGKFTWPGEKLACKSHLDALVKLSPSASDTLRKVFECECLGQTAVAIVSDGQFPEQHIRILDAVPNVW